MAQLKKLKAKVNKRFSRSQIIIFAILFAGVGGYFIFSSFAATTTTSKPPFAFGCESGATNVSTATALRNAVSNGQNACATASLGNVDLSTIKLANPVYVGTNGGSLGAVSIVGSKNIVIRQARLRSIDIRDSQFITIEKSTLGGTSSNRVLDNLITSLGYSPGIDTSDDVTIQDNDIGWTTADNSGNTGYGIRVYGGDRFKVLRNYIHHIGADGIQMGSDGIDNVIDRNEIAYVAPPSSSDEHSDDIQVTGHGPNLQITNNYLHHNGWLDVSGSNSGGSGPYIHGGSGTNSLRFENNLVRDERNFMQVADLGTGGTSISNLTFRRNTFYNNGTMWPDGTDLSWQIASGSNNLYERNVVNDNFGNKYGFGTNTATNNNLLGAQYTIDANGECTIAACNPASQEAIGYRCPTGVWWCSNGTNTTPPPTSTPGDTNNDGLVNIVDLSTLLSHYNTNYTQADFNKDNIVNITDLSILLSNFGKTGSTGGSCTNSLSCWPNASNTGYQNAPGYPGTPGVADKTKLMTASSSSTTCPLKFESHKTYKYCYYPNGMQIGSPQYPGDPDVGQHLTDVHFVGFLVEDSSPVSDTSAIMAYCKSDCTFDYFTVKPSGLDAPDVPAPKHGTTYAKSYGTVMNAGWGAYYGYARGLSLKHSDIWGYQSGIILGGDNTAATPNVFEDNWLHDQGQCMEVSGCLTHADGIGMVDTGGTAKYIVINHNNMPFIQDNTNDIAFQEGTYDHLTITNNILSGDGYTVAIWGTSTNTTFTGNVWTNYSQHYFGVNYGQNFWDTPGSIWAHNKFMWDPAGANPFYELGPGSGNTKPITSADNGKCWVPSGLSTTDYGGGSC